MSPRLRWDVDFPLILVILSNSLQSLFTAPCITICLLLVGASLALILVHIARLLYPTMSVRSELPERDIEKISKGWSIAMNYSQERLKRVYELECDQLENAVNEGRVVLETVCLFMHACIKHGQYK